MKNGDSRYENRRSEGREGKVHQIDGIIYTSAAENMIAMDISIYNLYKEGTIDRHTAVAEAVNPEIMAKRLNLN